MWHDVMFAATRVCDGSVRYNRALALGDDAVQSHTP